ncbi:MAG: hypothetical protein KC613_25465 [Myxococcales bacterium]|nr:hypothetical protein [Myxococcales bacterium]MCB9526556.1 hypothetical protein [Myxococcales bacterium]
MNFDVLIQQVAASHGWPHTGSPYGGYRIEVPTEYGRTQVVEVSQGADPDGRPLAFIWSRVTTIDNVGDPWYLLGLNSQFSYGALAVRDRDVILMETQLMQSADYDELQRAVFYVAKNADALEKQVHGHYDQN